MKKILIKNFPNLNNYGTAMMGLITIDALVKNYGKNNLQIYCSFDKYVDLEEINNELSENIELKCFINKTDEEILKIRSPLFKKIYLVWNLFFHRESNLFDKIIVLGGDDFSEYYSKYITSIEVYKLWVLSKKTNVILLGQTIGPFRNLLNRLVIKLLLPRINVIARDPWTVEYFKDEFNIPLKQMGDIAFNPLPLQYDSSIENKIMSDLELVNDCYFTVVVSGLVEQGYYCESIDLYLLRHKEFIQKAWDCEKLKNIKVVLLAHTFPPYGDESILVEKLYMSFSTEERTKITLIKDKILPTKARFILGNGLFSLTGRMHPAVSTLQMGKPAIILSYSNKYKGVIGKALNRSDLIIDSNFSNLWDNGEIVQLVSDKINYIMFNYQRIKVEIKLAVSIISETNKKVLENL